MLNIGFLKGKVDLKCPISPDLIKKYQSISLNILAEKGINEAAFFATGRYEGVEMVDRMEVVKKSDILFCSENISNEELSNIKETAHFISLLEPYNNKEVEGQMQAYPFKTFSMDMIPRTSLAQSMDVLSSMASVAGYKAVLKAADLLPRYLPMMITAAGSIKPSKVLVIGAGVAGLQAIATARRLGAMVEAFDVRSASKEEVESLGAKFVEVEGAADDKGAGGYAVQQSEDFLKRQQAEVQKRASNADIIITTAQLRGRPAPKLILKETVNNMKPGSVIIDLASSTGGNCEVTEDQKTIQVNGVTIVGNSALANEMIQDASNLLSNNIFNFVNIMVKDGALHYDSENEILVKSKL
ncbi:NAD(P) transhydrogenase subunit alpha [Portibacter lacus]|uniref:NAD(P) transhydrogenase subunit alpha part 1 n=1 Tax=Portibacter lacus TaxID=1099794 RepID=A0AA37WF90_9BACT|nr:NAD(P) transhydrogenase subunit alpha [Portibacter lacus]GLR18598.1 NAD(P) transhydrogenase subunit alpha [Portibacter lacus]